MEPELVPEMAAMGIRASSRTLSTPIWTMPRAKPPPRATPRVRRGGFGFGLRNAAQTAEENLNRTRNLGQLLHANHPPWAQTPPPSDKVAARNRNHPGSQSWVPGPTCKPAILPRFAEDIQRNPAPIRARTSSVGPISVPQCSRETSSRSNFPSKGLPPRPIVCEHGPISLRSGPPTVSNLSAHKKTVHEPSGRAEAADPPSAQEDGV